MLALLAPRLRNGDRLTAVRTLGNLLGMSDGSERAALRPRAAAGLAGVPATTPTTRSSSPATRSTRCCTRPAGPTAASTNWSAQRTRPELAARALHRRAHLPVDVRGRPLRGTADALAAARVAAAVSTRTCWRATPSRSRRRSTPRTSTSSARSPRRPRRDPELPRLGDQRVRPQRPARRRRAHPQPPDRSCPRPRLTCATSSPSSRWSTRRCCAELRAFESDYLRRSASSTCRCRSSRRGSWRSSGSARGATSTEIAADAAAQRFRETTTAMRAVPPPPGPPPTDDLKTLFRDAAKRMHPDLVQRRRRPRARRGVHEAPQRGLPRRRRGGDRQPRAPVGDVAVRERAARRPRAPPRRSRPRSRRPQQRLDEIARRPTSRS